MVERRSLVAHHPRTAPAARGARARARCRARAVGGGAARLSPQSARRSGGGGGVVLGGAGCGRGDRVRLGGRGVRLRDAGGGGLDGAARRAYLAPAARKSVV